MMILTAVMAGGIRKGELETGAAMMIEVYKKKKKGGAEDAQATGEGLTYTDRRLSVRR